MLSKTNIAWTLLRKCCRRSWFAQKGHNWWRIMGVWLWHWNQSPIIQMESVQKSQDRKKHVKFSQMWRLCSLFSSITMAWSIMNSCHKVALSIRNTTRKLCIDCAKQFVRNAQNCGKTNQDFAPWQRTSSHIKACAWVFDQKRNLYNASTTVFTGLDPRWLFPLRKPEDTNGRKASCYDWEDKRKIETDAVGDTKRRVS